MGDSNPKQWALGGLAALALAVACGGSDDEAAALRRAAVAEGCVVNSDCAQTPDPLSCVYRLCHHQCKATADCAPGQRCILGTKPEHICQIVKGCTFNSDCPGEQICGPDRECRDQCRTPADCVKGQVCAPGGLCADPPELANGALPDKTGDADAAGLPPGANRTCEYASDCEGELVCIGGFCKLECKGDKDCAVGVCVAHRCTNPPTGDGGVGSLCKRSSDCTAPYVCRSGACDVECKASVDCAPGRVCIGSTCVVEAPDGAPAGYGKACTHTSQCASGLVCAPGGVCAYECLNSGDCDLSAGLCCISHLCVHGGALCAADGGNVTLDAGSGADAGKACTADGECSDNIVCNGIELCVGGRCQEPAPPCDDKNPCTVDTCNANGTCEHTPTVTPVDQDGDGHFAVLCGGDDCDDKNPTVFTGAQEQCDQVDNNCNGYVDEGLWKAQPVTTLATGAQFAGEPFITGAGAPVIRRLADGTFRVAVLGNAGAGSTIRGYKLDAALAVQGSATTLATADAHHGLAGATDGSTLALGTMSYVVTPSTQQRARALRFDDALAGGVGTTVGSTLDGFVNHSTLTTSRPDIAWNGSEYLLVWSDSHEVSGTARVYASTMTTAGVTATAHALIPGVGLGVTLGNTNAGAPLVAAAPNTAFVAWRCGNDLCSVTTTVNLSGLVGSVVQSGVGQYEWPTSAVYSGTSFFLASIYNNTSTVIIRRFHRTTGALLGSASLYSTTALNDVRLAASAGGVVLTVSQGTYVRYGWLPEALNTPTVELQDFDSGGTTSAAAIAVVDSSTYALAWQDGAVKARLITCRP